MALCEKSGTEIERSEIFSLIVKKETLWSCTISSTRTCRKRSETLVVNYAL